MAVPFEWVPHTGAEQQPTGDRKKTMSKHTDITQKLQAGAKYISHHAVCLLAALAMGIPGAAHREPQRYRSFLRAAQAANEEARGCNEVLRRPSYDGRAAALDQRRSERHSEASGFDEHR